MLQIQYLEQELPFIFILLKISHKEIRFLKYLHKEMVNILCNLPGFVHYKPFCRNSIIFDF